MVILNETVYRLCNAKTRRRMAPGQLEGNPCFLMRAMTVLCEGDRLVEMLSRDVCTYIVHPGKPDNYTILDDT